MSLDNFRECAYCNAHLAVSLWMKLYGSHSHARMDDQVASPLMAGLLPGPTIFKMDLCFGCKRFSPSTNYTPEEEMEIKKYSETQMKACETGRQFEKLMGRKKNEDPQS